MKRVDVLKSIEQILVQKAYETGHISHRSDGDWQKQADGSWTPVKGGGASASEETPTNNEPQPDQDDSEERAEYERQLSEEQARRAEEDPTGYGYEEPPTKIPLKQVARHLLENGDYDSVINQINFEEDDGVLSTYDDSFELIVDNVMNDMGMSDEEKKANRGIVSRAIMERVQRLRKPAEDDEKVFLKEQYGIDVADYKDSDSQAIRDDLATTYGLKGSDLDYVADLVMSNLPEDDVEKSIRKVDIHAPAVKNMGF